MAQQRSGLHGHTADSTEATGGGKGAEHRDEAETSKLFEGTGSVTGEVDGDVKDLWARVKELEALVHALQVAARDDIETLREENDALKQDMTLLKKVAASEHKAVPSRSAVDASAGRERIESWELLKKELKLQFLPGNASWIAREALRRLSQTGTLRDYVKAFSSLMLDIQSMSDEDKLFNFMAGLQPWAQSELRRQNVKDLSSAIAAADGLVDFAGSGSQGKDSNKNKGESGEGKSVSAGKSKRVETMAASTTGESRSKTGCWNCGGDHLRRNCPKKQTVNALKDVESNDDDSAPQRCSPLQLI
nr:Transposon Tf2-2 polyprotein [Ipomoea batatas]GMD16672.1 Transposon Tf2-2 polyprotein [Ipomoea batatas]